MTDRELVFIANEELPELAYAAKAVDGEWDYAWYDCCSGIPDARPEKPLLLPTRVVVIFASNFDLEALNAERQVLLSDAYKDVFSVLVVIKAEQASWVSTVLTEYDDFLLTDFTPDIFRVKIGQLQARGDQYKKFARDLHEASEIALLSMSQSSELGEISRFILTSYNCKTFDELLDALFDTIKVFEVTCSALIIVDDSVTIRVADNAPNNVREVLLRHHNLKRVHHAGADVMISFAHASMMVHNLPIANEAQFGHVMDNITILGNCFEARVKGIHSEQEASAASRAKTLFLATMSHELRTPMNSVIGFTDRLISKLDGRLNAKEERQLNAIKRNGEHLLSIINDILDMSKIEVGLMEIHPEPIDPVELVRNVFTQLQPIAQNNQLRFELTIGEAVPTIQADAKRLTQVMMNLASNAIKYTEKGSVHIHLECVTDDKVGECLSISVKDTGIGISQEDQLKLFDNFVQIDSALSRKVEGTGLGLAISMVFANMHGGRIDVESKPNDGSCFTLILPVSLQENANKQPLAIKDMMTIRKSG